MITFSVLLVVLLIVAVIAAFVLFVCGAAFTVVFGDLIVCILIIWLLVRLFRRKK